MKSVWTCFILLVLLPPGKRPPANLPPIFSEVPKAENLFIITLDGFRWQEVFRGADPRLLGHNKFTFDKETISLLYGGATDSIRRQKLLPFFWTVIANKGQLIGNREQGSKMNVANHYARSYPGYNEIFAGNADPEVSSNRKINNPHQTVLEMLNELPAFRNRIAVFSSWDVFPWIFNIERSGLNVNSGYLHSQHDSHEQVEQLSSVQFSIVEKSDTRYDLLTFLMAKEYLKANRPRVVYLGLGETDEFAHEERYDLYLKSANQTDQLIADLWHWIQTTQGYSNKTTLLITTDHGRGNRTSNWMHHGEFIRGSSQTWMAIMGPGIPATGENGQQQQFYQQQLAVTMARLLGEDFKPARIGHPVSVR